MNVNILNETDVAGRFVFARKYAGKPQEKWINIDCYIDNKTLPVYITIKAKHHGIRLGVIGVYKQ